jgi:hypothetical protein
MTEYLPESGSAATDGGRFPKGTSGNPAGRPKGSKNLATRLKNDLELAVRQAISVQDVIEVWTEVVKAAKDGSRQAQKLVLDYTLTKPREADEDDDKAPREYRFLVIDARQIEREEPKPVSGAIYDNPPQENSQ